MGGIAQTEEERECEDCGIIINPKRVAARPEVTTCILCQEEREASGRFVPHRMDIQAKLKCGEVDALETTLHRGG